MKSVQVIAIDDYGNAKVYTRENIVDDVDGLQELFIPCDCGKLVLKEDCRENYTDKGIIDITCVNCRKMIYEN